VAPNYSAVGTVVLDAAAPQVKSLSFHQTGRVGQKLLFAAEPFDISAVSFRWYFGDRHNARGARVTHVYRKAGRYAISLIATDAAGHRITVARTSVRVLR
jgi:PKD repeat protein